MSLYIQSYYSTLDFEGQEKTKRCFNGYGRVVRDITFCMSELYSLNNLRLG